MARAGAHLIFETRRFDQRWPDDPDADAPPGRDLAEALAAALAKRADCSGRLDVTADDWEHTYWVINVDHGEEGYTLEISSSMDPEQDPGRWWLGVYRGLGLIRSLFGAAYEEDEHGAFHRVLEEVVAEAVGGAELRWVTQSEALDYV